MTRQRRRSRRNILRRYRGLDWFVVLLLFIGLSWLLARVINPADNAANADFKSRAIAMDGDSLKMNGLILRLEGIDAVEYDQTCQNERKTYACGKLAHQHLKGLLRRSRNQIKCILKGLDKYERTLAVCYPKDADENTLSLNAEMVRAGWAISFGNYSKLENEARTDKRGLWAGEFVEPQAWRHTKP